jgi:hypothetical protein
MTVSFSRESHDGLAGGVGYTRGVSSITLLETRARARVGYTAHALCPIGQSARRPRARGLHGDPSRPKKAGMPKMLTFCHLCRCASPSG